MSKPPFNWTCPYCRFPQVVTASNYFTHGSKIRNPITTLGKLAFFIETIVCQNSDCGKLTFDVELCQREDYANDSYITGSTLFRWALLPESSAKPQPDFIPAAIVADYVEACRIRDLSPKASATLARRCLQGMIRDFCGISRSRLIDEIKELRRQVDANESPRGVTHESIDAIDAVREVGNIGAHMEKDVDLIVDIEDGEAQILIDLIETLFDDWYVQREVRKQRFAGAIALAEIKRSEKEEQKRLRAEPRGMLPPPGPLDDLKM